MKTKLIITAVLLATLLWLAWPTAEEEMPSCHAPSGTVMAQDRPSEPEGNPTHDPDKAQCATKPDPATGMIACECHKWEKCDGTERRSCSNFCYAAKCKCAKPCV